MSERVFVIAAVGIFILCVAQVYRWNNPDYPSICKPNERVTTKFRNNKGVTTVLLDCERK